MSERPLEQPSRRHGQTLLPEIDRLFREADARPADCDLVGVSIGPGSFTGLRVGVVCAKTLAYARGCRIVAVDTFLAVADNSPADVDAVWVIGDAQRGDLFVGRYRRDDDGRWTATSPIRICEGREWCAAVSRDDVVTGPAVTRVEAELAVRCRLLEAEYHLPRAAVVAQIGMRRSAGGDVDDFWQVVPFYLRPSAAEEKADAVDATSAGAARESPL